MRIILKLIKRNSLNYLYDKTSVFFSFLSVLIIIFLYAAFLAKIQVDNVTSHVGDINGIRWLIDTWILAGVITVNTVTVPLSIISNMIFDIERGQIDDFLTSPISRKQIVLGYLATSWVLGIIISIFTLFVGQIYILVSGGEFFSLFEYIKLIGLIIFSVVTFSSISFFIMTFLKSVASVSVLNTLIGTLIGFLAGIYLPVGMFTPLIQFIVKINPAAHIASLFRRVMTTQPIMEVFQNAPSNVKHEFRELYGLDLSLNGFDFTNGTILIYLTLIVIVFFSLSVFRINKIKR